MLRKHILGLIALMAISVSSCSPDESVANLSPEEAMQKFYAAEGAEDQLMDPLIVAGDKVVPLLLAEVPNKDMPLRRYAIGALGNIQNPAALPVLETILEDETEIGYFRCDALNAIGMIDFQKGQQLSKVYQGNDVSCLTSLSAEILQANESEWRGAYSVRTREEALIGRHD